MPKYLSYKEVAAMCGVHVATIWRWRKSEGFPEPVKLGRNTTRFEIAKVEIWLQARGQV